MSPGRLRAGCCESDFSVKEGAYILDELQGWWRGTPRQGRPTGRCEMHEKVPQYMVSWVAWADRGGSPWQFWSLAMGGLD